ncbi:hypothetical protein OAL24_01026 [Oenococcus sicerae]|nr:hypothetical protein OAL24_01026 [Oenococcus sicerae]
MKKELISSALKTFTFIYQHADKDDASWKSNVVITPEFVNDCNILEDLDLIEIQLNNDPDYHIRITNKGMHFFDNHLNPTL